MESVKRSTSARTTLTLFIPDKTTGTRRDSPDSAFQTGSEFNDSSLDQNYRSALNDKVERWVRSSSANHTTTGEPCPSSDEASTASSRTLPNIPNGKIIVSTKQIEEQVEEILHSSYTESSTSESIGSEPTRRGKTDWIATPPSHVTNHFDPSIPYDVTELRQPLSWESNWLFKKKKFCRNSSTQFRTIMFIPNPIKHSEATWYEGEELEENEDLSLEEGEGEESEGEELCGLSPWDIGSWGSAELSTPSSVPSNPNETLTSQSLLASVQLVSPLHSNPAAETNTTPPIPSIEIKQQLQPTTMRIAEREKQKWNNPAVPIKSNNPYTPENLLRRMRNNSFLSGWMGVAVSSKGLLEWPEESGSAALTSRRTDERIRRDYYMNSVDQVEQPTKCSGVGSKVKVQAQPGTPPSSPTVRLTVRSTSTLSETRSGLHPFKSPSVKDLTLQFTKMDEGGQVGTKTMSSGSSAMNLRRPMEKPFIRKEIHSLTARSVPRQFREGLRLAKSPIANSNIKS